MENNVKSYRKPYVRPVKANWWADRAFYVMYMLREGTALTGLLVALELLWLVVDPLILKKNLEAIHSCTIGFISNPLVIIINIIALVSAMYHAFTWFNLMPLVVRVFKSKAPTETKFIPRPLMVCALWCAWVVATVAIILFLCLTK
jgi:fumarate reductase subunit C